MGRSLCTRNFVYEHMLVLQKDVFSIAVERKITSSCQYEEPERVFDNSVCIANSNFFSSDYIACIKSEMIA
jgi:hypothetical protein